MVGDVARPGHAGLLMARGRALLAGLGRESAGDSSRRLRVVTLEDLFRMPRYCEPSPDPEQTLATHRASLEGKARLAAEFPHLPDFRASLAWSHHALSATLTTFGRSAEAEAHGRRAVAMFDDLLREHPSVDHYRRWGALAAEALGVIFEKSDRPEEAGAQFRRAIAILPESQRMRDRLARKLEALGDRPLPKPR